MKHFVIYKCLFKELPVAQASFDFEGKGAERVPLALAQRAFDGIIKGKILMHHTKPDGEVVDYPAIDPIHQGGDVVVLRVQNAKVKTITQKFEDFNVEHNPWCYVVIDNREGVGQIAIERSAAFRSKTDKVRELLAEYFNARLAPMGLRIELPVKHKAERFWSFVRERIHERKDSIKRIELTMHNPRKCTPVDMNEEQREYLEMMSRVLRFDKGVEKGTIFWDSPAEGTQEMSEEEQDMRHIVHLCNTNGAEIVVRFRKYGVYRLGKQVIALYELNSEELTRFEHGQKVIAMEGDEGEFALTLWLDEVREMSKTFADEKTGQTKVRKRKG